MRKHYIDNIRWLTGLLVVVYHVIYMYNGVLTVGVIGPFQDVQYQDAIAYLLYPWFMVILFVVSGISTRASLQKRTAREFFRFQTRKLLVPSTIGLFAFQWILGYFNMAIGGAFDHMPQMPGLVLYGIMAVSGTGVLWYVQSYEKLFAQRQLEEFGEKRMYHLQGDTEAGKAFAIGGELSANSLYQDVQTNINE